MIDDKRKNVKWATSMMLPEHVELLRQYKEEQKLVERPYLDEYMLVELQDDLERAYSMQSDVTIKTWKQGVIEEYSGVISEIDIASKTLYVEQPTITYKIKIEEIVYVRLND